MIDKLETVRQVLASAIEQGLPGAQAAMSAWTDVNVAIVTLKSLEGVINRAVIDEEDEDKGCPPWKK